MTFKREDRDVRAISASNNVFSNTTVRITGGAGVVVGTDASGLSISASAQTAQTQSNIQAIAASDTTYNTGQVQFTGSNMVTVKSSANQRVVIDATQSVQTQSMVRAISASDATFSGTVRITGGPNITAGTDANGISLSAAAGAAPSLGVWENYPEDIATVGASATGFTKTVTYQPEVIPGNMKLNNVAFLASVVGAGLSFSAHFGVYTYANSTSANLLGSVAESFVVSAGSSGSVQSKRDFVLTSPGTHTAISSLTAGNYVFGLMLSCTATGSMQLKMLGPMASSALGVSGAVYPGTNQYSTGTSQGLNALFGYGSTTVNALPSAVSAGDLVNQTPGSIVRHHWLIRS